LKGTIIATSGQEEMQLKGVEANFNHERKCLSTKKAGNMAYFTGF
jgi:hypothetical protein